jgi:hypothetical protein
MGLPLKMDACFRAHVISICLLLFSLYSQAQQQTDGKTRYTRTLSYIGSSVYQAFAYTRTESQYSLTVLLLPSRGSSPWTLQGLLGTEPDDPWEWRPRNIFAIVLACMVSALLNDRRPFQCRALPS